MGLIPHFDFMPARCLKHREVNFQQSCRAAGRHKQGHKIPSQPQDIRGEQRQTTMQTRCTYLKSSPKDATRSQSCVSAALSWADCFLFQQIAPLIPPDGFPAFLLHLTLLQLCSLGAWWGSSPHGGAHSEVASAPAAPELLWVWQKFLAVLPQLPFS